MHMCTIVEILKATFDKPEIFRESKRRLLEEDHQQRKDWSIKKLNKWNIFPRYFCNTTGLLIQFMCYTFRQNLFWVNKFYVWFQRLLTRRCEQLLFHCLLVVRQKLMLASMVSTPSITFIFSNSFVSYIIIH